MFSWVSPKCAVRDTETHGKGLFALGDIRKGELISVFGGYVITRREE